MCDIAPHGNAAFLNEVEYDMGLTAVLNDTQEKSEARGKLIMLLGASGFVLSRDPSDDACLPKVLETARRAGVPDERLAALLGIPAFRIEEMRAGVFVPHKELEEQILEAVKNDVARMEAAVAFD